MTRRFCPPNIEKGARAPWVAVLQVVMRTYVNDDELSAPLQVDGIFGDVTEQALKKFQVDTLDLGEEGADGKCGPVTQAAILEHCDLDLSAISPEAFAGPGTWTRDGAEMGEWTGEMVDDPRDSLEDDSDSDEDEESDENEEE